MFPRWPGNAQGQPVPSKFSTFDDCSQVSQMKSNAGTSHSSKAQFQTQLCDEKGCGRNSPLSWVFEKRTSSNVQQQQQRVPTAGEDSSNHSKGRANPSGDDNLTIGQRSNGLRHTSSDQSITASRSTASQLEARKKVSLNKAPNAKAQQFLHGNDSSDEDAPAFFNAQPEPLLDIQPEGNRSKQQSSTGFTQPKAFGSKPSSSQPIERFSPVPTQKARLNHHDHPSSMVLSESLAMEGMAMMNAFGGQHGSQPPVKPYMGESRIVAPNVSKLSPNSAVEVRLQSSTDSVIILCAVDVLKMRSGYFHNLLTEQETQALSQSSASTTMTIATQPHVLWRDSIVLVEPSPFEAAAFLESLHEGRAILRGEWNYCWTRLSVIWEVEDLIMEYAAQIDAHMQKLAKAIQQYHWRTNPSILAGMRICIFRKGSNPAPTIVNGSILESPGSVGYSKVRVAFDNTAAANGNLYGTATTAATAMVMERTPAHARGHAYPLANSATNNNRSTIIDNKPPPSSPRLPSSGNSLNGTTTHIPLAMQPPTSPKVGYGDTTPSGAYYYPLPPPLSQQLPSNQQQPMHTTSSSTTSSMSHQIIGDVAEPFWVQEPQDMAVWCDPDELFAQEAKKWLTVTDKRMFWEMAKALIELPEITRACKGIVRSVHDLTSMMKRAEFRVLWTPEAADIFPPTAAADLIRYAYAPAVTSTSDGASSAQMSSSGTFHGQHSYGMLTADVSTGVDREYA